VKNKNPQCSGELHSHTYPPPFLSISNVPNHVNKNAPKHHKNLHKLYHDKQSNPKWRNLRINRFIQKCVWAWVNLATNGFMNADISESRNALLNTFQNADAETTQWNCKGYAQCNNSGALTTHTTWTPTNVNGTSDVRTMTLAWERSLAPVCLVAGVIAKDSPMRLYALLETPTRGIQVTTITKITKVNGGGGDRDGGARAHTHTHTQNIREWTEWHKQACSGVSNSISDWELQKYDFTARDASE
jgi:hypothetical protein